MHERHLLDDFHSTLGGLLGKFLQQKRASGYRYITEAALLRNFDRFLIQQDFTGVELPKDLVEKWTTKRAAECSGSHRGRICTLRQFTMFMLQEGYPAYVPDSRLVGKRKLDFIPYIFTREQFRRLLEASDHLLPHRQSPLRHLIMPELFRLLYGCGLRLKEALRLTVVDVNLSEGLLTIRRGKFGKDRLVPMVLTLTDRLRRYSDLIGERSTDAFFFPAPDGGHWSQPAIYKYFRQFLRQADIPHEGRRRGPRLHDIRHGFAVHTLIRWYEQGADLNAKLPVLATYMGHESIAGTQRYLHLIPELFPHVTARLETVCGHIIPRRTIP